MQPERWKQIRELLESALEWEPSQRTARLEAACGSDASLLAEVTSLLVSHEKAGEFTDDRAFEEGMRLIRQSDVSSPLGRRIGPYRVIREIGHGGMGAVYLAARDDEAFQKNVAIKLIRRGLNTESIIQRFRSERQILASLDHPNITRLFDAGTTDDGLPYFVMEYIQGEPIDRYCDGRKLNTAERLRLFQSVCGAVHYAHQNLVIHRDIKPGNVLVTAKGVPRLLDFGIAKLLNPELASGAPAETLTAARLMTPEYASPEQVRGEPVTTGTDVYSLGVVLYELLTGHKPYRLAGRTPANVERAICEEEPEKPSAAVAGVEEALTPQSVSATREGTPDKLRRRLAGDLDNIVLMAMRKEPPRRYGSVEQFSEDIRRHLAGLPVIARPDTPGYRATKFLGRHKGGVAAAALIVLTMGAGVAATAWQARVAAWQARTAAAERDRARLETAKAERINALLRDTLSYSSPHWTSPNLRKDPDLKASELVAEAAERAEAELSGQPEALAGVQHTIGNIYNAQGRLNQAEPLLRAALEKDIRLYGADHPETAGTSRDLASVLFAKGDTTEAQALARKALEICRKEAQGGHPDFPALATTLSDLGTMVAWTGDTKAAEAYLREGLQYAPKLSGKDRAAVAIMNNELASVLYRSGDLNEVERLLRTAIDEFRKLPAGTYAEMAVSLSNLGAILVRKGRYEEAEPLIREGLEVNRKVLGNNHLTTAGVLGNLADLLYNKGDYQSAEQATKEWLQILRRTLPRGNLSFASPLTQLGLILNKTGRSREGEKHLREALEIRTRLLPSGSLPIGASEGALGECLTTEKRYAEAEPLLLHSSATVKAAVGKQDPRTTEAAQRLTVLYESWGKPAEAARYRALAEQASAPRPAAHLH